MTEKLRETCVGCGYVRRWHNHYTTCPGYYLSDTWMDRVENLRYKYEENQLHAEGFLLGLC